MVRKVWANRLTVFTNAVTLAADVIEKYKAADIKLCDEPIERITGNGHKVDGVVLKSGRTVKVDSLWCHAVSGPTVLVRQLGLKTVEEHGQATVSRSPFGETSVPGIYCAGKK